jgi:hypothetical protein
LRSNPGNAREEKFVSGQHRTASSRLKAEAIRAIRRVRLRSIAIARRTSHLRGLRWRSPNSSALRSWK